MRGDYSPERLRMMAQVVDDLGVNLASIHLGVKRETLRRAMRRHKNTILAGEPKQSADAGNKTALLRKLEERYSENELLAIAAGGSPRKDCIKPIHDFRGKRVVIGAMSDTHLGSSTTNPDFVKMAFAEFKRAKVDMVTIGGDITEGLSRRDGHVYECTHIGFAAQKKHAIQVLERWDSTPIYMIDGNHDRWYKKASGAQVVSDICDEIDNAVYLGEDEGDIELAPGCVLRIWHGEDSSSYAHSYRLQKLVESFTGGEKPSALFAGHVHKMGYFFIRHVHCISTGAIQSQSKWMRSKRMPAHTGFWIVEFVVNEKGIARCKTEWFPFYV